MKIQMARKRKFNSAGFIAFILAVILSATFLILFHPVFEIPVIKWGWITLCVISVIDSIIYDKWS